MASDRPIISFVTPCYDRHDFVRRCIESIPEQFRDRVEHIIVDGGSTDGTIDVIRDYPHVVLISEPDDGLYDAANKGIAIARGKWIGFLATDDFIDPDFFANFFGSGTLPGSDASLLTFGFALHRNGEVTRREAHEFHLESIFHGKCPLFTMLVNNSVASDCLRFDSRYRIAGDFDLTLKMLAGGLTAQPSSFPMMNFWMHEGSLTGHSRRQRNRELLEVIAVIVRNLRLFYLNLSYVRMYSPRLMISAAALIRSVFRKFIDNALERK